ncbi:MAG TPA: helix-turn-helix transcriptional regulator [Chitinophagaceae bacterium]|nr:helix-turn-helix transcriptional regulator [Chitinophagaceae bacterium]
MQHYLVNGFSDIAFNLKRLRTEKAISQEDMAKKTKVHANHLSRYERGLSAPSIEVVEKMAKLLDVSIDELVFGSVSERMEKNISDRELLSMFQKIQSLGQQQQDTVKDFISAYLLKADLQKNLAGVK